MAKILLLQTTQLQTVVCHFLGNKHSIVVLQGLIYNCRKSQTKKPKLSKGLRQNTKLSKCLKVLNQDENI